MVIFNCCKSSTVFDYLKIEIVTEMLLCNNHGKNEEKKKYVEYLWKFTDTGYGKEHVQKKPCLISHAIAWTAKSIASA